MPRRILLCTIGSTAQIVTETVWALRRSGWSPDEIHVVTTGFAIDRVRRTLQADDGPLARLLGGIPPLWAHVAMRDGGVAVFPPSGSEANLPELSPDALIADAGTDQDASAIGDLILRLTASFAAQRDTEIHLSLAGGRKTMSAHALLALTLVGRPQDQASHVLVSPTEFEDNPAFWHPDQGGTIPPKSRRDGDGARDLDPRDASVTLVRTPTPLLRFEIKGAQALANVRLGDLVRQANIATAIAARPSLVLDRKTNTAVVCGEALRLKPKSFSLLRLLASARSGNWPGVGPDGTGPAHAGWLTVKMICERDAPRRQPIDRLYLAFQEEAVDASVRARKRPRMLSAWEAVCATTDGDRKRMLAERSLSPALTRLRADLRSALGAAAAAALLPPNREHGVSDSAATLRFGLGIPPEAIRVV